MLVLTSNASAAESGSPHVVRFVDAVAGRKHTVTTADGTEVASCVGDCAMRLTPGDYVLYVGSTTDRWLEVTDNDMEIAISREHIALEYVGLGTALAGMTALTVGTGEFFYHGFQGTAECDADCSARHASDSKVWPYLALGGFVATIAGWVMYGTALTKIEIRDLRVAVVPTRGGFAAAFGMSF